MARKGILTTDIDPRPAGNRPAAPPPPKRGAVGALQSSLTKLQENAVQDIDPGLIDDAGLEDRLGVDAEAQTRLRDSLKTYGQQVPVLLRPHATKPGRFEIVYGRRRLAALKDLGLPVRAMIRHLDDQALVMAQGQENTSRQDLSFIEKASFAAQLDAAGYERQTIADALSVDLPMVSRLLKVGTAFEINLLRAIGSAPGIGRDRWMALAGIIAEDGAKGRAVALTRTPDFVTLTSDDRFEAVYARAAKRPQTPPRTAQKPRSLRDRSGAALAEMKQTGRGVTLSIPARTADGFDAWFADRAETILQELHDQWRQDRSED